MKRVPVLTFLPLLFIIFVTGRLWIPLLAELVGEHDRGVTYELSPYWGGELIKRDSTQGIYGNVLSKQQLPGGAVQNRNRDEGTPVSGYFINLPLPSLLYDSKGFFYYDKAPFVKEWFTHLPNLFWLIFLLFLQGVFIKYFYGKGYEVFLKKKNHS